MPETDVAENVATSTDTTLVNQKASDVIADAASKETDSDSESQDETLLGKDKDKAKEGEVAVPPKVVPEKYDLKVPEGMSLDQSMMEKVSPIFKEIGLSNADAQKLADVYAPYIQQTLENERKGAIDFFSKMVGEWKDETVKTLGTDHQKELAFASKALDKLGTPELRTLLNQTGVGNSLPLVKFMIQVGKMVSQDHLADGSAKVKPLDTDEARAETLYPTMKQ